MSDNNTLEISADLVPVQIVYLDRWKKWVVFDIQPSVIWGYPVQHRLCQGYQFAICDYGTPDTGWAAVHVTSGYRATQFFEDAGLCAADLLRVLQINSERIFYGYLDRAEQEAKNHRMILWEHYKELVNAGVANADVP